MKDKLDISLRIGDVAIRLTIKRSEEKLLRDAAREINHAWEDWRKKFNDRSPREILAMVTLLFAKGYLKQRDLSNETDLLLGQFEDEIDKALLRQ